MKTRNIGLITTILSVLVGSASWACDCRPPSSTGAGKAEVGLVFAGDVLSKEIVSLPALGPNHKEYLVKLRVHKYWKGILPREVTVRTFIDKADCGFPFENGKAYLIYALDSEPPLVTMCSRSVLLEESQAEQDMLQLGTWKRPKE